MNAKTLPLLGLLLVVGFFIGYFIGNDVGYKKGFEKGSKPDNIGSIIDTDILNFNDCVAAGYAIMESYPRQCRTESGDLFVENIGNVLEKQDLIQVYTPQPNDRITSPLKITGEARGYWFFEATAPVILTDWDGLIIAEGYVTTDGEWMTEDMVPFSGELEFSKPIYGENGTFILHKANPSDLPENDDALEFPILFE